MKFKERTLAQIADMICGNFEDANSHFPYRSSSQLTRFFRECDTDYKHDGSTRNAWVTSVLTEIFDEPPAGPNEPPETFLRVIRILMDQSDAKNESHDRANALKLLNSALAREGYEAFYADDKQCYLRHLATNTVASAKPNPHRPLTAAEVKKRDALASYLDRISEDELIEQVLLPLYRQMGYHRVTAVGHKDKSLEYGKDVWMKYTLPTQHVLYFGIQAKIDKIDASAVSETNISTIHNQALMMLGHEVFDAEVGRKVLVDHAFIVSGGEITKAARNWLAGKLDASKRSQILFMDREDILNLYVVNNLPLPSGALPPEETYDPFSTSEIPF